MKKKTKKVKNKLHLETSFLLLIIIFFIMFLSFFVSFNHQKSSDFWGIVVSNIEFNSGVVAPVSLDLLDTLGNATLRIYAFHGQKVYESILFTKKVMYVGSSDLLNIYSKFFQNTFVFDIDSNIRSYSASVSGGVSIVKERLNELLNLSFLLKRRE